MYPLPFTADVTSAFVQDPTTAGEDNVAIAFPITGALDHDVALSVHPPTTAWTLPDLLDASTTNMLRVA